MQKVLFVVFVLISQLSLAQDILLNDTNNFKIQNDKVIWQYVYETELAENDIVDFFKKSRLFEIQEIKDKLILGTVVEKPIDYKRYGFKSMNVPIYIRDGRFDYNLIIEIKNGRYRVTISDIYCIDGLNLTMNLGGGISTATTPNTKSPLEEYVYNYKKKQFKSSFLKKNSGGVFATVWYNTYLIDQKQINKVDDNW